MSSDLVANLRAHADRDNCVSHDWGGEYHDASEDCVQAAEEIERLRATVDDLVRHHLKAHNVPTVDVSANLSTKTE